MRGLASAAGAVDAGEDRGDDLVAEDEQGGDGSGLLGRDVVAAGSGGFDGESLAAELAQVIGGLPDRVVGVPVQLPDLGGVLGDGEAVWRGGQGQCRGQAARILGLFRSMPVGAGNRVIRA